MAASRELSYLANASEPFTLPIIRTVSNIPEHTPPVPTTGHRPQAGEPCVNGSIFDANYLERF